MKSPIGDLKGSVCDLIHGLAGFAGAGDAEAGFTSEDSAGSRYTANVPGIGDSSAVLASIVPSATSAAKVHILLNVNARPGIRSDVVRNIANALLSAAGEGLSAPVARLDDGIFRALTAIVYARRGGVGG